MDTFTQTYKSLRNFDCACGKKHCFDGEVYEGADFETALRGVMPEGTHILYTGCSQSLKNRLKKLYRITELRSDSCTSGCDKDDEAALAVIEQGATSERGNISDEKGAKESLAAASTGRQNVPDGKENSRRESLSDPVKPPVMPVINTASKPEQSANTGTVRLALFQEDFFALHSPGGTRNNGAGSDLYDNGDFEPCNTTAWHQGALSGLEDIRLVVSDGPGIHYGKYIAGRLGLKHVIAGGGNLSQFAYVSYEGFTHLYSGTAPAIICDETLVDLPRGFAETMLTALSLFEWNVSSLLSGNNKPCITVFTGVQKALETLLTAAKRLSRHSAALKTALLEAQLRVAVLGSFTQSPALMVNGAFQAAAAQRLLFTHEQRPLKDFCETAFLFAPILARAYKAFLSRPLPFCPPPDNNLRASRLAEFLGVEDETALNMLPGYLSRAETERGDYRLQLYREEIKKQILWTESVLDDALAVFFRLYDDDGFSFKGYMDSLDVSLCIGLGPDVMSFDTLLAYMRQKGVLDKYIL